MSNDHGPQHEALLSDPIKAHDPPLLRPLDSFATLQKQPCRKRKHSDTGQSNTIGEPFFIHAHSSFPSPKAQKLIPRLLLQRASLPLAVLDLGSNSGDDPDSRLFTAHITLLESAIEASEQPRVLIAESAADARLCAIEKVDEGIYALCNLVRTTDLNILAHSHPTGRQRVCTRRSIEETDVNSPPENWWHSAALSQPGYHEVKDILPRSGKAHGAHLCLQRPVPRKLSPNVGISEGPPNLLPENVERFRLEAMASSSQGIDNLHDMIRFQYHEALYASKTSLAYFAKGPLSRARAATLHDISSRSQRDLAQFLRSSVLALGTMDIKYRETLPGLIKGLPFEHLSEDDGESIVTALSKKIRKSRKTKIGKNGLYPREELDIARWWLSRDISATACDTVETREEATRVALLEQRAKETQMQIILVLEILALEVSIPAISMKEIVSETAIHEDMGPDRKTRKARKQQDLNILLDLLIDRLCIWHSMSVDEGNHVDKERKPTSSAGAQIGVVATDRDHLRQFCVDVVLPFYAARLPELTNMLCQKLGGLKQPSPRRPPLSRDTALSTSPKPGAAVQRLQGRKPRRTLERVMTDERSGSRRIPSLARSATEPSLPRLKREVSDVSLASIPLNRVAMHKRYSQREVDLDAASTANEAKLKKKAKVEQELHSAIAALKKPNPRMAVKELVEHAEKRAAGSHLRKPINPIRKPLTQGVQITATPSNNRQKDVFGGLSHVPRSSKRAPSTAIEEIPPSSASRIIDSSRKPQASSTTAQENSKAIHRHSLSAIDQTPTRQAFKIIGRPRISPSIPSGLISDRSPLPISSKPIAGMPQQSREFTEISRPPTADETPTKHRPTMSSDRAIGLEIKAIPVKSGSMALASDASGELIPFSSHEAPEMPMSIYATLGWDDEVDELS